MPQAIDFGSGLDNAWSNVATFIPKFIAFLVILVVGYIVARVISKLVTRVLQRVGFDRLVERGGVRKALENSQYDAAGILAKLVFYAIMLFVLSTAFGVFGSNPISDYLSAIVAYLPRVFVAIVIVVIAAAIAAAVKALIQNSLGGLSYARILANCASGLVLAFGIVAALDELNIAQNVVNAVLYAALAAIVGVIVVAVGGGGIRTMSSRWEAMAAKYDEEKPRIAEAARNAPSLRQQADQARGAVTQYAQDDQGRGGSDGQQPAYAQQPASGGGQPPSGGAYALGQQPGGGSYQPQPQQMPPTPQVPPAQPLPPATQPDFDQTQQLRPVRPDQGDYPPPEQYPPSGGYPAGPGPSDPDPYRGR